MRRKLNLPKQFKMPSNRNLTIISILIPIALLLIVSTKFFGLNHLGKTPEISLWISRIELWIVLLITYLFAKYIEKKNFLLWTEQKRKPLFYLTSIIIILAGITFLLTTISIAEQKFGLISNNKALNSMNEIMCNNKGLLILTCLTAAFTEEFIFRAFLLPRLQILLNNIWISIFLSSLLFGLTHFGYSDINRMLFPFIIGIIFSYFYYKYRSLTVLIICHFLMDFYSLYGACK
jgi:membrane protease YdiL (CAAX protease family)